MILSTFYKYLYRTSSYMNLENFQLSNGSISFPLTILHAMIGNDDVNVTDFYITSVDVNPFLSSMQKNFCKQKIYEKKAR